VPGPAPSPARTAGTALGCVLVSVLLLAGCGSSPEQSSDSSAPPSAGTSPVSQSITEAIKGIDAAVYAYGIVGAHLSGSAQRQALRAITTLNRQRLGFELALGAPAAEAAVAYQLPAPVTDATQAKALAELLEMKLIPLFDQVAAVTDGASHALALKASRKAAQRAQHWAPEPAS